MQLSIFLETRYNTKKQYRYEIKDKSGEKLFDAVHSYETYPPRFEFNLFGPNGGLLVTHKLLQCLSSHLLVIIENFTFSSFLM